MLKSIFKWILLIAGGCALLGILLVLGASVYIGMSRNSHGASTTQPVAPAGAPPPADGSDASTAGEAATAHPSARRTAETEITVQRVPLGIRFRDFAEATDNAQVKALTPADFGMAFQALKQSYDLDDYFTLTTCPCFTFQGEPAVSELALRLDADALAGLSISESGDLDAADTETLRSRLADLRLAFVFISTGPYHKVDDEILPRDLQDHYPLDETPDRIEANRFDQDRIQHLSVFFDDYRRTRIYLKDINRWARGASDKGGLYYFSADIAAKLKAVRQVVIERRNAVRENEH